MEVVRHIERRDLPPTCVAVGVFDGVHMGHAAVLRTAVAGAEALGVVAAALTFDPHPEQVLRPRGLPRLSEGKPGQSPALGTVHGGDSPLLLTTIPERAALIEQTGIDILIVVAFDAAFASQSPECFAQRVLVEQLHARCVVAGEGFIFGRGGQGDLPTLTDLGRRLGFSTTAVQRVTLDGEIVSSSRVRELIAAGDIGRATAFLGHYYTIAGRVVTGDRRGRAVVGIPTANLCVGEGKLLPPNGVYAVWAHLEGAAAPSPAVVNIGVRPTFAAAGQRHVAQAPPPVNPSGTPAACPEPGERGGYATMPCVEAHLLDADASSDLYDRQLTLEVVSRLREERAFDSPQALAQQIRKDIAQARRILDEA